MDIPRGDFIGPCVHGRDPFDRCDFCGNLMPWQAEILVLRARIAELEAALDMADEYMSEHVIPTADEHGVFRVQAIRAARAALAKKGGGT